MKIIEGIAAIIVGVILIAIVAAVGALIMAFPFMWLWNHGVCVAIPGLNTLTYWPSFCMTVFMMMFLSNLYSRTSSK